MEMAHDGLSFASFGEENSRSRLPGGEDLESRARKRPASANVRALFSLRKRFLGNFNPESRCLNKAISDILAARWKQSAAG
jgi:hypothetical protein